MDRNKIVAGLMKNGFSKTEALLVSQLLGNKGYFVSHGEIAERIYYDTSLSSKPNEPMSDKIRVMVSKIRKKLPKMLPEHPSATSMVDSKKGKGYRIKPKNARIIIKELFDE